MLELRQMGTSARGKRLRFVGFTNICRCLNSLEVISPVRDVNASKELSQKMVLMLLDDIIVYRLNLLIY